jgi:hypothetical protein
VAGNLFLGNCGFLAEAFALNPSGGTPGFLVICTLVVFPTGLFYFGPAVSGGFSGVTDLPSFICAALLGYVVYGVHLVIALKVKARRIFWVLLLVLIVLVCMNVVGCSYIGNSRPHM